MKPIRTAFIFDPMGDLSSDDDDHEVRMAIFELEQIGLTIKNIGSAEGPLLLKAIANPELIILDYGGMSLGAYDTAVFNVRYVCDWMEDHPNCLLVLWTGHTVDMYRAEIQGIFEPLPNIVLCSSTLFGRGEELSDAGKQILKWFEGRE